MGNNHKGIDALSAIIDRSSSKQKYELICFACSSVGLSMEPTGLKPTRERTLRELHWDFTLDDLRKRLVQLVDEIGLIEQVVVEGVLAFLISVHRTQADSDRTPRFVQNHLNTIEHLKQQLCLPASERENEMSDEELKAFIAEVEDMLGGCEARQQDAQETLRFLQREVKDTFTDEFWKQILLDM